MVDRRNQHIARPCIETCQQLLGAAENGDRQLAAFSADIGVAADDRHAKGAGCRPHAFQNGCGTCLAIGPDGINHSDRPATHGGDVGDVHHDAAPAGKPGVGGDELVHETFDGKKQMTVAIGQGGAIVADGNPLPLQAESCCDRADILLGGDAAAGGELCRQCLDVARAHAQAAFLGRAIKPASGVMQGG